MKLFSTRPRISTFITTFLLGLIVSKFVYPHSNLTLVNWGGAGARVSISV